MTDLAGSGGFMLSCDIFIATRVNVDKPFVIHAFAGCFFVFSFHE